MSNAHAPAAPAKNHTTLILVVVLLVVFLCVPVLVLAGVLGLGVAFYATASKAPQAQFAPVYSTEEKLTPHAGSSAPAESHDSDHGEY